MLCCLRCLIACNSYVFRIRCAYLLSVVLKLSFGSKVSLIVWVWLSIELSHEALHARNQLFMATLLGQFC
jgi:hypothetical protein